MNKLENRTIWVGIDAHARQLTVAMLSDEGEELGTRQIRVQKAGAIEKFFRKLLEEFEVRACYEAGPTGYWLCRKLRGLGVQCAVVAPSRVPREPGDRVKTDRRDAKKLARLHRAGQLTEVRVPTEREESVRDVVRQREDVRRHRARVRDQLVKFLLRHNLVWPKNRTTWTLAFWSWLQGLEFPDALDRETLDRYIRQVRELDVELKELDRRLEELAEEEPYRTWVRILTCFRGIRLLSAMILAAELVEMRRFATPMQLMGFLGLVPREWSSGERVRRGGLTKTGNSFVRRILAEAAWTYRRKPSLGVRLRKAWEGAPPEVVAMAKEAMHRLHRRWWRLTARGKNPNVATTAVARELAGFLWAAMWTVS